MRDLDRRLKGPSGQDWQRAFGRAALVAGVVITMLVIVSAPRGGSDSMLIVSLDRQECEVDNVFVGDQLIRAGAVCRLASPVGREAAESGAHTDAAEDD